MAPVTERWQSGHNSAQSLRNGRKHGFGPYFEFIKSRRPLLSEYEDNGNFLSLIRAKSRCVLKQMTMKRTIGCGMVTITRTISKVSYGKTIGDNILKKTNNTSITIILILTIPIIRATANQIAHISNNSILVYHHQYTSQPDAQMPPPPAPRTELNQALIKAKPGRRSRNLERPCCGFPQQVASTQLTYSRFLHACSHGKEIFWVITTPW